MSLHKIEKQYLLGSELSEDALILARAIYNTYIQDNKNLYMRIKLSKIEALLEIPVYLDTVRQVTQILEEINEPIGVKNFKFYAKEYPLRFLVFCSYEFDNDEIEIYVSEEFLFAEEEYMIDNFLTKQR